MSTVRLSDGSDFQFDESEWPILASLTGGRLENAGHTHHLIEVLQNRDGRILVHGLVSLDGKPLREAYDLEHSTEKAMVATARMGGRVSLSDVVLQMMLSRLSQQ